MDISNMYTALPVMRQLVMMRKEFLQLPEDGRPALAKSGTYNLLWGEILCLGELFDGIVQSMDKIHNDNSINTSEVSIELEIKLDGRIRKKIQKGKSASFSGAKELLGVRQ